jgi:hypothetical protein
MRESLEMSGLKEGAAEAVGESSLWELSEKEEGVTNHRCQKHNPQKRNNGKPVGWGSYVACRPIAGQRPWDKQIYKSCCCWVTASQTNMFLWKRLNYNTEEQCFLCGQCQDVIKWDKLEATISQSLKRGIEGWCEMAANLGVSQLEEWVSCGIFAIQLGCKQRTLLESVTRKQWVTK